MTSSSSGAMLGPESNGLLECLSGILFLANIFMNVNEIVMRGTVA